MALATDRQSVGKRSDFLRAQHLFNNLPGWCFSSVSQNVSQMFLGRHLWCHFSFLIEGRTHQFKFRMLILHRGSDILVPHRLHHRCQIPGLRQYPCTVIMPAAIQDQLLGKTRLRTRCAKLSSHIRQMAALRSLGWKQPSFASSTRSSAQHLAHTIAHGNHPSTINRLAVRHKDNSVVPIEVPHANAVELSLVPHSRIPREDDDVPQQLEHASRPIAPACCDQQLLFRMIIQS